MRLSRLLLALWLCASTAFAAARAPDCADEAEDVAGDPCCAPADTISVGPPAEDAGDEHGAGCDRDCAACACCRPPIAPISRAAAAVHTRALGHVQVLAAAPPGASEPGEIFQPPRA